MLRLFYQKQATSVGSSLPFSRFSLVHIVGHKLHAHKSCMMFHVGMWRYLTTGKIIGETSYLGIAAQHPQNPVWNGFHSLGKLCIKWIYFYLCEVNLHPQQVWKGMGLLITKHKLLAHIIAFSTFAHFTSTCGDLSQTCTKLLRD